jgi:hypothetical protein
LEISNSQDSFEFYNGIVFGQDDGILTNYTKNKGKKNTIKNEK